MGQLHKRASYPLEHARRRSSKCYSRMPSSPATVRHVADDGPPARGSAAAARVAAAIWEGGRTYVADPRRVTQTRDIAVIVAAGAVNVVRRGSDGAWRYVISLLSLDALTTREED